MLSRITVLPVSRRIAALGNILIGMIVAVGLLGIGTAVFLQTEMNANKDGQRKLELAFGILQDAYSAELLLLNMNSPSASEARARIEGEITEVRDGIAGMQTLVLGDAEAELEFGHTTAAFAELETALAALFSGAQVDIESSVFYELRSVAVAAAGLVAVEADMLKDALEEDMAQLASRTQNAIFLALVLVVVLGSGSVVLAASVSRHIARGLAAEIGQSVTQTRALAEGDLTAQITGTDKEGELGELARALLVFRDNAAEGRRLAAEAQVRADELRENDARQVELQRIAEKSAAREREVARRATITDLADKVGAVVKAAAEGDFTRRIEAKLSDPELDDIAQAINALVENVEAAVDETARVMSSLTEGDLTRKLNGSFKGIFGRLQGDVNTSLAQLQEMVSQVSYQCDGVSDAAAAMKARSQDLARRAEQQAVSLEESSANMEEIRQSVRSSTDGATHAAEFARTATERVEEAGQVVASAVKAMSKISEASSRIGDIVSFIDSIAFQTNLLALNASVEAARAGGAGRGFAVVASEVRALAQRSSDASKDIRSLIEESASRIKEGVSLVERTGSSLSEIQVGVTQMSEIMQTLRQTAQEQACSIGDVTDVIQRLDTITQKNAAIADETLNTAVAMEEKVAEMRRLVGMFRTNVNPSSLRVQDASPKSDRVAASWAAA